MKKKFVCVCRRQLQLNTQTDVLIFGMKTKNFVFVRSFLFHFIFKVAADYLKLMMNALFDYLKWILQAIRADPMERLYKPT